MEIFKPKVTIIIPVYNGANFMREAIDSALSQTYNNIEIIVVNDGSDDDGKTDTIARSYGDSIRYFSKSNGGVASALNFGIERMSGKYFSWLSHDDVYYPDKLETQIGYLGAIPDKTTIICGGYHIINERSEFVGKAISEHNRKIDNSNIGVYLLLNGLINGCSLLINKDCFYTVGNFDVNLRTTQDYALWFKMFRKYPVLFHKEILLKSRVHPEQGSLKEQLHQKEAADLWIGFIEEITKQDIQNTYKSLPSFYYSMAKRLRNSFVPQAYDKALEKLRAINYEIKVSVILPTYNRRWCLQSAIDSVLMQTFEQYELIIVDDGSTDDTQSLIDPHNKKIKYIYQQQKGAAAARNTGIRHAQGEYIAFIDSDDIWTPDHLEKHIRLLDEKIEYAMTYNFSQVVNQNNEETYKYQISLDDQPYPNLIFIKWGAITTPSVVMRKLIVDEIGFFDETMDMCEDLDLWRRIAKLHSIKCIPEFLTIVHSRLNHFEPNYFFKKRKIFIEKAIKDDSNMPENTIRDLYMELYRHYYLAGCTYDLIFNDLLYMTSKQATLKKLLEEHMVGMITGDYSFLRKKVSIIIPVYNGSQYLRAAIDSALAQTYENIEIIVVNDGSKDEAKTEAVALSYGEKIRYFSKPNGGVATALNLAIKEMRGEYFSWLSHDDLYYPQKIERQMAFLQKMKSDDIVLYSDYALIDANGLEQGNITMDTVMLNTQPLYSVLRAGINGCSLLIPRKAFEEVGLFDETLRTTQDYDLWLRMQLQGKYRFVHQPEVLVKYRVHNQQDTKVNPATLPEATALWIGFYDKLTEEDILACEESRYLFLRGMAEFLEKTPYHEAAEYYRQLMFREKAQGNSRVADRLRFSSVGRFARRVKRYLAKKIAQ